MAGVVRTVMAVGVSALLWAVPAQAEVNRNPAFIQVYDNNVENLVRVTSRNLGGDPAAALQVAGGDANVGTGGGRNWYALANGDSGGKLGMRDVTFAACRGDPGCISRNWTVGRGSRIDFVFTRKPGGLPNVSAQHTISFEDAGRAARRFAGSDNPARYSDHRAIRARIHY